MSDEGFRIIGLNAVVMITVGLLFGGFPLLWVVVRDVYGQHPPIALAGDYRGWMMAHLEGILNGLLLIGLAAAARVGPMTPRTERIFVAALLVGAWGNTVASVLAPALGVRGMTFDATPANNLVTGLFSLALVGTFAAIVVALRHLTVRRPS
jgi:hypothetical protein